MKKIKILFLIVAILGIFAIVSCNNNVEDGVGILTINMVGAEDYVKASADSKSIEPAGGFYPANKYLIILTRKDTAGPIDTSKLIVGSAEGSMFINDFANNYAASAKTDPTADYLIRIDIDASPAIKVPIGYYEVRVVAYYDDPDTDRIVAAGYSSNTVMVTPSGANATIELSQQNTLVDLRGLFSDMGFRLNGLTTSGLYDMSITSVRLENLNGTEYKEGWVSVLEFKDSETPPTKNSFTISSIDSLSGKGLKAGTYQIVIDYKLVSEGGDFITHGIPYTYKEVVRIDPGAL